MTSGGKAPRLNRRSDSGPCSPDSCTRNRILATHRWLEQKLYIARFT